MAHNPYKLIIKELLKDQAMYIQRDNDWYYYVSTRYIAVKIPEFIYKGYFQTVNGYFIDLEADEKATYRDNVVARGGGFDVISVFEKMKGGNDFIPTRFVYELSRDKKGNSQLIRVLKSNDYVTAVNEKYYNAVRDIVDCPFKQSNALSGLIWASDNNCSSVIVMPIRMPHSFNEEARALLGGLMNDIVDESIA